MSPVHKSWNVLLGKIIILIAVNDKKCLSDSCMELASVFH